MDPITVAGTYNPVSPAADTAFPVWFYITFPDDVGSCAATLVISAPSLTLLGAAGDTIPFAFDELNDAIGTTNSRYRVYSAGGGAQIYDTLRIMPPANVASGVHAQTLTLSLYENGVLIARGTMAIAVTVLSACTLPAPDVAALDFSAGIQQGRILPSFTQTAVIHGASCTGPGRLTLRGEAMTTDSPPTASFTNRIDYRARASMASAAALLSTAEGADAVVAVPPGAAPITIDVSLLANSARPAAGRYASTLRVTLEPAN